MLKPYYFRKSEPKTMVYLSSHYHQCPKSKGQVPNGVNNHKCRETSNKDSRSFNKYG